MTKQKITSEQYQEHLDDIFKVLRTSYGDEVVAVAMQFTQQAILPGLLLLGLTGKTVPDPEYVMFVVARQAGKMRTFEEEVQDLYKRVTTYYTVQEHLFEMLDEATTMTEEAGVGPIAN